MKTIEAAVDVRNRSGDLLYKGLKIIVTTDDKGYTKITPKDHKFLDIDLNQGNYEPTKIKLTLFPKEEKQFLQAINPQPVLTERLDLQPARQPSSQPRHITNPRSRSASVTVEDIPITSTITFLEGKSDSPIVYPDVKCIIKEGRVIITDERFEAIENISSTIIKQFKDGSYYCDLTDVNKLVLSPKVKDQEDFRKANYLNVPYLNEKSDAPQPHSVTAPAKNIQDNRPIVTTQPQTRAPSAKPLNNPEGIRAYAGGEPRAAAPAPSQPVNPQAAHTRSNPHAANPIQEKIKVNVTEKIGGKNVTTLNVEFTLKGDEARLTDSRFKEMVMDKKYFTALRDKRTGNIDLTNCKPSRILKSKPSSETTPLYNQQKQQRTEAIKKPAAQSSVAEARRKAAEEGRQKAKDSRENEHTPPGPKPRGWR